MLIILEGPDGAGKTTLARALEQCITRLHPHHTVTTLHKGPPRATNPFVEYEQPLWRYRAGTDTHIICDRWHIGEFVYPSVLNRPTIVDDIARIHIELFLKARGALLLYVHAPVSTLQDRLTTRGDDLIRPAQIPSIINKFSTALQTTLLTHVTAAPENASDALHKWLVSYIIDAARSLEHRAAYVAEFRTFIGNPRPKLLLLGDRRAVTGPDYAYAPAFVADISTSGRYLLDTLRQRGLGLLHTVGIANACDVDNADDLWVQAQNPVTVALGRRAHLRIKWDHHTVQHPQYVRRFRYHEMDAYLKEILEGVTL